MTKYNTSAKTPERVTVIGAPVSAVNMEKALDFVDQAFESLRGTYICAANAHTSVMAREDPAYQAVQTGAVMNLPDGKPLELLGKKQVRVPMEKITGTHFMQYVLKDKRFAGKKHYFYGTRAGDLEKLIPALRRDYPHLQICGWEPSLFRELTDEEVESLAARVREAEADFLWVALGAPRQEKLMFRMQKKTDSLMVGVGGAFHILAGTVADAPEWMQQMGLEWFFRLCHEPRRLLPRYLVSNTKFIFYALRDKRDV